MLLREYDLRRPGNQKKAPSDFEVYEIMSSDTIRAAGFQFENSLLRKLVVLERFKFALETFQERIQSRVHWLNDLKLETISSESLKSGIARVIAAMTALFPGLAPPGFRHCSAQKFGKINLKCSVTGIDVDLSTRNFYLICKKQQIVVCGFKGEFVLCDELLRIHNFDISSIAVNSAEG